MCKDGPPVFLLGLAAFLGVAGLPPAPPLLFGVRMADKKIVPLTLRLESDLMDELMHQALAEDRSVADVVRRAVRAYVGAMRALTPQGTAAVQDNVMHDAPAGQGRG